MDDRFLDSLHKSFLNQTTLDLRKEKWTFLDREFTVPGFCQHMFDAHTVQITKKDSTTSEHNLVL